jgi:hypothetical protein
MEKDYLEKDASRLVTPDAKYDAYLKFIREIESTIKSNQKSTDQMEKLVEEVCLYRQEANVKCGKKTTVDACVSAKKGDIMAEPGTATIPPSKPATRPVKKPATRKTGRGRQQTRRPQAKRATRRQ